MCTRREGREKDVENGKWVAKEYERGPKLKGGLESLQYWWRERVAESSVRAVHVVESLDREREKERDATLNQRNNNTTTSSS